MSKIEVDQIDPQSGTNLTVGSSGDTVTVTGNIVKSNAVQASDGGNIISQSGTTITLGASGDTINIASGATLVGGGIEWQSSIVTASTVTVEAGKGYWLDTSSNAITVTFPGSASVGDRIILTDYARNWATNNVTINQNSLKFQGNTSPNPVYSTNGQSVDVVYSGTTKGWIPNSDDDVGMKTPQAYTIEYLVVAGGGSAAFSKAGGGGAGGMRTNFGGTALTINGGTTYTATVGAGGASGTSNPGPNGNASSLAGSDITNVTTVGGGGGGQDNGGAKLGQDGGSGGGGGFPGSTGGSGTAGEGNDGGSGFPDGTAGGGGGGGKGAVGADATSSSGGAGGVGQANSITGSSVFYAGGGGGTTETSGTQGAGGNGGGGNAIKNGAGGNGTANTGGGGGAANDSGPSGGGGSGVVIITMADGNYSGTVTGSPVVATNVGGTGKTSVTFTGTGTYVG